MESMIFRQKYYGNFLKEKYLIFGLEGFQEREVLELLLAIAARNIDVRQTAQNLLNKFGSFNAIINAPVKEILKLPQIGINSAILLKSQKDLSDFYFKSK